MNEPVLITGASRGIGEAIAYALARRGYPLILTYRTAKEDAEGVANTCLSLGATLATVHALDVLDNKSIEALYESVAREYGALAALVNNAGIIDWKPFFEQSMGDIETLSRTNLEGVMKVARVFAPVTRDLVLNVASDVGTNVHSGILAYSASKAGVIAFSRGLSELVPARVVSVSPDQTATAMNEFLGRPPDAVGEAIARLIDGTVLVVSGADVSIRELL